MASTKDLYDELKGNPLVNVKDDYETFNSKLKDPNFLKRLDEVMLNIGKDINAYDIPKKKKDGEDESSQPTEQPSANTEPTQADGVEPEGRPKKGEPGYNRKIGPDEAFISQGWIDRGTWWEHPGDGTRETRQVIYKPIKEEEEQVQMPATDVQEQPEQIEQPERPETPETDFQGQPERPETPTTDFQGQPERAIVPENSVQNVISQQEPDPVKSNKIVTDANVVSGNTFKRKKKDSDFKGAVITYTPDSASDQVFIYEQGKVRSMDKRSNDYSDIIAKNPYTVQLKNSDAFKDLIQLQKEGNKQAYQNYLETIGNPAAREVADFSFGAFSPDEIMLPTIMSGADVDRNIPVNKTLVGKLKTSNLYNAAEGLWNNIINKEVDRPWQKEEVYDADEFINNVDPNLSDEERQAQSMFDSQMAGGTEEKGPRQLKFPSYVYKKEDNEIVTEEEQKKEEKKKRASIDFLTTNPETGELELGDVNDLTEIERYNLSKAGSKAFLNKWEEEKAKEIRSEMADTQFLITGKEGKRYKSDFLNNPANQAIYNKIKDSKFAPQQGGSELEIALATISNKQANADFKNLNENGYKDAYSTQIRTPYDIQNELDNVDKILDSQPNMSYDEKMKLYKQKESLNQALLNVYEQNIQDYATYLRNTGHEKAAADMLSTYDYYKKKTGGFQTLPVKELNDADKRAIMNIRGQAINTTMRYLQAKYQTLSNTVDINGYQKLAQKPLEQVAKQFEILKSIGALDENGNINPSAKIKQSDQVKLSDAILKINLAKDQIASAAEATGANPENINELTRLGEKLGNLQNTQTSFYQKNAMEDLREEDENDKKNQKIAEDRMKSDDFFTSFFYTALYGGSNLIIPGLSTLAKIGKVPDIIADALGDETQLFDQWSAYIDEMIKDMNAYQPQDMTGLSGTQKFWLNTTAGISNLGAYAASGLIGGPLLTGMTMMSDMTDMAKANGLDDDEAAAWGLFTSMLLGKITQLVPESKNFYDALKPSTKAILKEWAKGNLTRAEAMGMYSKAIMPSLGKHFTRVAGETGEEMFEELTTQVSGKIANLAWDNASFNNDFDPNSIIASGESAASLTAFLAPFQRGGKRSVVEQDVLLSFAQNKNYILRNISFESQDELNEINKQLTELEAMEVGLQSMPGYTDLSNGKKAEVLSELYRAKGMELAAKNRGLGKNDPGFIEAEKIREDVLNSLKTPEKGEVPTQTESQKPETNAVQEPSTTEVLPSQQGEVRETGRKRQGMEPSVQGEEVTQEGGEKKVNSTEESQAYVDKLTEVKNNAPEDYWSVSIPEVEDVENGTIITNEDGQAVVGADGDIKAVYKNPDSEAKRVSDTLLKEAIKAGGIKLDNFDIYLTKIYKENGFKIVSRLPFNEDYAPDGWNKEKHGTPDVVAMIYDPENKLNIEEKQFTNEQYDEAMAYRDTYVDAQREAYPAKESDVDAKAQEERKSIADQVRSLKSEDGRAYSAALGIPIAIWDGAVELIATSIEAGESFVNAINKAKEYLKQQLGDDYNEDIAEEFMDEVINQSPLQLNNTDKVKGTPVRVNPDGHNLSFVKEEDLIDIDALIKDIEAKGETVWFWVADQLGRGYYMDSKTGNKHYLDAGPSYALDPKNRKKKVIWASGVTEKTLNKNIKKADYIFIISGSPEKSKLFNKAVFQVFQEKIGDYNTFKKEVLANKPIKGIKEVLEAHDSWESLIEDASVNGKKGKIGTGRKKFLNELVDASKKPNSSLYKVLKDRDALVNVDDLRDGFYADNNFQQNDIMLVLKPEKLGDKSEHSTYENDLMGEVVGVPNKKINAYEILPNKLRGKKGLNLSKQSSKTAPYGSGLKPVSASQNIARGLRQSADLIRKGKRGGLAMNPIDPFLEVIAKALEAGASLTEAIAKGLEAFKNSDFYKNLTAQEKGKAVNDLKKAMDEQIAPTIANLINEEMLKGKGVYTASQNVKKEMIKEGVVDEATFDRIVGKAEKIVKAQAEQMIVDATDKAVEDIRSGAGLDNALNALSDFINNEIGFYKSQDKTLKKDLTDKARKNVIDELSSKIAGDAKSYMEVDNMSKADAIEKALGDATSSGMEFSTVDQLRDSVKNSIDKIKSKDSAEARKNEPVVTTTDKEIMKDKLKAMDSALKEAVAKAKQDKKDEKEMRQLVRTWVKDYLKTSGISAKISPVQMRAIVSRATGVVSDMTDAKMKALTDYVEKVVANQEYAQMINDLEKNKKGASKKRHNQYTEAVRKYLSLPLVNSDGTPLMNDQELKAYAESVARLNQSVPDHSRMDMNLADRVLNDYTEIPSKLEKSDFDDAVADIKDSTIDDLEEYNEFVKKVNKAKRILDSLYNNGKINEDEYNSSLEDLYTKENGLRVYEQDHQDQIDDLKENMIDDIVDMSNYVDKSGFIGQQGEVYKRLEVMLKKPEMLMSLDVKDIVKLTEVMDRMADGFVAEKELREIVNKAETRGQKKGESIVNQLASIYKSLNSPDLTKLRNLLKLTEPAQIERVLGLSSGPIYNNIIQPINSAFTKMRKNTERLMDDYYKARQESKFKGDVVVKRSEYDKGLGPKISDKITVKADKYYSTRVAMLSSIFDYASKAMDQKADTKDFWGENLEKADVKKAYHNDGSLHIVNDIYSKLSNDPRFQTNGKLDYTKIYEAFLTDPKSVMSEAEYKLYEATQRINKTEIGEALVSANAIRGVNGEISAVHYPRKSLGKSSAEDADLVAGTGGKVGGLRAGSSYARVLETPKDAIDLNLDRVMATQIYEASRDLYLNDAIQQTNEVFRNAKENANPDEKAILQAIQDWNRKRVDFELEKSAKNVITRAFGGFASYALIGKVRTPAEFATNLLSGVFNQLSNLVKIGPKALISPVNPIQAREALKLMEKFDSPVQFMGWTMKSYAKYGKGKVDKDNLSSFYNNAVNMLMNISGPLTAGEWKSDFDAKFKELTGEKYNEAKHLENDEYFYAMQQASSYANQQIERIKGGAFKGQGKQFVAVNPITDIKKLFPGVKIKDEEGMVSSSETFAQMTNIFNNFVGRDVKNFVSGAFQAGTGRDISGGIKDMIGSSYRLGSYYLIYNLIDAAMKSALGDDEEKKKGDKKMEMFTTEEGRWDTAFNTVLNFVTTVATSKYGANGRAIAVGYLNYLYNSTENKEQKQMASDALASMYFQEPVETGQYGAAEKFIYMATTMYIPPADVIANQAQKEFDRLSGSDKYKGATITDFFDQAGKFFNDPEVVEYRKFLAGGLTLMSQIGVVTGINLPFVKDAVKLIKKDVQDKQNIVILNKNGENMVEGVLDFDIDGNAMVSVTVDVPGMPADQKKVLNETLSNSASDKFNKLIEKNKERVDKMPENNVEQEAEKFALVQYYHDLAVHQAKVEAKLAKPEEAPKEPSSSSDYFESQEQKKKWVEAYQAARATGKFSSASKLSTSKDLQEGVQKLIDSSPYKDSYNALDPKKVENVGAIKAMNTYFNDLYKYNVTPVPGKEPKASDYFYKDYNGKITPVE
jgi:hypothetical protein